MTNKANSHSAFYRPRRPKKLSKRLVYHKPEGDPCRRCGLPVEQHRRASRKFPIRTHLPVGDPCSICSDDAILHDPNFIPQHEPDGDPCKKCGKAADEHRFFKHHRPTQDPCEICGLAPNKHRVPKHHAPIGDPCVWCGKPACEHEMVPMHKPEGDPCKKCGKAANIHRYNPEDNSQVYVGVDGEGQDEPHKGPGRGKHKYVFLGAAVKGGSRWSVENYGPNGLSTRQCLNFFLKIHKSNHRVRFYSFAFNYDLTMILKDLPNETLYKLFRPELRQRLGKEAIKGPKPVFWDKYMLNLQGSKFTLNLKGKEAHGRNVVIWDIFKFYGKKFTESLKDWKVGSPELIKRMTHMKDQRGEFDKLGKKAVQDYCYEECECMSELAEKLVAAHEAADLKLTSFYGAGSSASAMLKKMDIQSMIRSGPTDMDLATYCAFAGGRFENQWLGTAKGPIYNYDIASAYPYQLCFLPCLLHAKWVFTRERKDLMKGKTALVRYVLRKNDRVRSWGPFPFRDPTGRICFPASSGGGWVWRDEYIQGEKHFPNVSMHSAWVLKSNCNCGSPFRDIPHYYRERVRIGKEGAGIVLKLGMNSSYGKLAQSVGKGLFKSWIWAGMITSGCRAQILEIMGMHKDRRNLLMIATDGIYTREKLHSDVDGKWIARVKPKDTDTWTTGKPLGAWEIGTPYESVFCARPGIYFPSNPTEKEIDSIRARGIGKSAVLRHWKKLVDSYETHGIDRKVELPSIQRFCGAKTSISRSGKPGAYKYKRSGSQPVLPGFEEAGHERPKYGSWIEREVKMDFDPMPKRSHVNPDGNSLKIRHMPPNEFSQPYSKGISFKDPEIKALARLKQILTEQPEGDLEMYGQLGDE